VPARGAPDRRRPVPKDSTVRPRADAAYPFGVECPRSFLADGLCRAAKRRRSASVRLLHICATMRAAATVASDQLAVARDARRTESPWPPACHDLNADQCCTCPRSGHGLPPVSRSDYCRPPSYLGPEVPIRVATRPAGTHPHARGDNVPHQCRSRWLPILQTDSR
jgi:hypothetical protein